MKVFSTNDLFWYGTTLHTRSGHIWQRKNIRESWEKKKKNTATRERKWLLFFLPSRRKQIMKPFLSSRFMCVGLVGRGTHVFLFSHWWSMYAIYFFVSFMRRLFLIWKKNQNILFFLNPFPSRYSDSFRHTQTRAQSENTQALAHQWRPQLFFL